RNVQLQLALPMGRDFDRFRCELPRGWGWPIENLGQLKLWNRDPHPAIREIGRLLPGQEIYIKRIADRAAHVFLALLPWVGEATLTFVIGFWSDGSSVEQREVITAAHAEAVQSARDYFVPSPQPINAMRPRLDYVKQYDWIVTEDYVG